MTLRQFLLILRARWRVALSVFIGVLLLAIGLFCVLTDQYTASASVVVDANADPVASASGPGTDALLQSSVTTEVDIISSERVARSVVKATNLDQDPKLRARWQSSTKGKGDIVVWIANYLRLKKLTVTPTRTSNVIDISVTWPDAQMAAVLANAYAEAAIATNIAIKVEPAKQYANWFIERSSALRRDLEAKQKRLSDFQASSGIIATDEKLDVENARLTELSTQLVDIQGQRQDSQSRQRQTTGDNEALPEVLESPVIQSLKASLSKAEATKPDIEARLGKNHPDYQAIEAEIATLRERISQETAKITASLADTTQVNLRREADIRRALDEQKARVLELKHRHDEAAVLDEDVQSAQRDLDAVTQRYAQSSLESQIKQTTVVQLTFAVAPIKPSSPILLLILALGLVFGTALGMGAAVLSEKRDARIRDAQDLHQLLGIALLARIGRMPAGAKKRRKAKPASVRIIPSGI